MEKHALKVRIGINPITWSNDDVPELGGDTPLETCLAETKLAGYAGTELGGKFPRQSSVLKPIMERFGLAVVSGWYDGRILERERQNQPQTATAGEEQPDRRRIARNASPPERANLRARSQAGRVSQE